MSRYLLATEMFYNAQPIVMPEQMHAGVLLHQKVLFKDITMWAKDKEGDWFQYVGPGSNDIETMLDRRCWPSKKNGTIQLARDYWRHIEVKECQGAPYYKAIGAAKFTKFK